MHKLEASELIINSRGALYHIDCRPEEIGETIITVGDPNRVKEISKYFDSIEIINQHREFIVHTGYVGKKRISVASTGIGVGNVDIVINELDALVNIDLESRTIKDKLTSLQFIRLGTCGSLQEDVPVDSFVASTFGIGLDNLLHFYLPENNEEGNQILHAFNNHTQLTNSVITPYINRASIHLLKEFVDGFHQGITVTCPGFYGPQGRMLRMGISQPQLINKLTSFNFGQHRICNFEMETSAMYGLTKILGHQCLSLSTIVANRIVKEFTKDANSAIHKLIKKTIETVSTL